MSPNRVFGRPFVQLTSNEATAYAPSPEPLEEFSRTTNYYPTGPDQAGLFGLLGECMVTVPSNSGDQLLDRGFEFRWLERCGGRSSTSKQNIRVMIRKTHVSLLPLPSWMNSPRRYDWTVSPVQCSRHGGVVALCRETRRTRRTTTTR